MAATSGIMGVYRCTEEDNRRRRWRKCASVTSTMGATLMRGKELEDAGEGNRSGGDARGDEEKAGGEDEGLEDQEEAEEEKKLWPQRRHSHRVPGDERRIRGKRCGSCYRNAVAAGRTLSGIVQ